MWPATVKPTHNQPAVSILTPTYNRRKFLPALIRCIEAQTYPKHLMEWVVFDDSTEPVWDILEPYEKSLNIRYFRSEKKLTIGAKRNHLHMEARGTILVNMDDDDFYFPDRVRHAVHTLNSSKCVIAGSSRNRLYFTDDGSIWEVGPYGPNHATFGTMAYTVNYAITHPCDETVAYAEEVQFTKRYTERLAQLSPDKVMLVLCHRENTFNKDKLRNEANPNTKRISMKIKDLISDKWLRDFYASC